MIDIFLKIVGILFTVSTTVGYIYGLFNLKSIEDKIFNLQDSVDNIDGDEESKRMLRSGMFSQAIF